MKNIVLPEPNTVRWVKSRKLAVLEAIEYGILDEQQACKRYNLSHEELESWQKTLNRHGPEGLRTTHLKKYREKDIKNNSFPTGNHTGVTAPQIFDY